MFIQQAMSIFIPNPQKKRALIIVDMQSGFLPDHAKWIIPNVKEVIEECIESSNGSELRNLAVTILRNVDLTNHSLLIKKSS